MINVSLKASSVLLVFAVMFVLSFLRVDCRDTEEITEYSGETVKLQNMVPQCGSRLEAAHGSFHHSYSRCSEYKIRFTGRSTIRLSASGLGEGKLYSALFNLYSGIPRGNNYIEFPVEVVDDSYQLQLYIIKRYGE
jgi:hypothetical protein